MRWPSTIYHIFSYNRFCTFCRAGIREIKTGIMSAECSLCFHFLYPFPLYKTQGGAHYGHRLAFILNFLRFFIKSNSFSLLQEFLHHTYSIILFFLSNLLRSLFQNLIKLSKEHRHSNHSGNDIADRLCKEYRKHFVFKEQGQNENKGNQKDQLSQAGQK